MRDDDDVSNEALDGDFEFGMMRDDDIHLNRPPLMESFIQDQSSRAKVAVMKPIQPIPICILMKF